MSCDSTSQFSVLIIGFGAFGQLAARMLAPYAEIAVCDPAPGPQGTAQARGLRVVPVTAAGDFDLVLLAVPVPVMAQVLRVIAPLLRPGQIVADVCSVKQQPVALMQALLPPDVQVIGTHPMFGPESISAGGGDIRIVLCPVRGQSWHRIAAFLRRVMGLSVIVTSPEDHDRHAALTQGLTHVLARAMADFQPHPRIRTRSFDLLAQALAMVASDAPEVFEAVTAGNPHLTPLRNRLAQALMRSDGQSEWVDNQF